MKKHVKQFFAALLCLCMVAAVIPAGVPQAAASEVADIVLNFRGTSGTVSDSNSDNVVDTGANWSLHSTNKANATGFLFATHSAYAYTYMQTKGISGAWVAVKVNIPAGGKYATSVTTSTWTSNDALDVYLIPYSEDVNVGELIKSSAYYIGRSGDNRVNDGAAYTTPLGDVNLAGGNYLVVFKQATLNIASNGWCYSYLSEFKLEHKGNADYIPTTPISFEKYEFTTTGQQLNNWTKDDASTAGMGGAGANYYTMVFTKGENKYGAFKINVADAGVYSVAAITYMYWSGAKLDWYLMPYSATADCAALTTASDSYIGTVDGLYSAIAADAANKVGRYAEMYKAECIKTDLTIAEKGEYLLVAKLAEDSTDINGYPKAIELMKTAEYVAPEEPEVPTGANVLGANYAYLRNSGDGYVLDLFGAVKETEGYSAVGFEYKIGDGEWTKVSATGTDKVYTSFGYSDETEISLDKFGADCKYVFTESVGLESIAGGVTIRAYAVAGAGETATEVYGYEGTLNIAE